MSFDTPPTFVAGDPLAAADLNVLGDDIVDLDSRAQTTSFFGVALVRSSNQSIANATDVDTIWESVNVDQGTWWDSGTPAAITVPAAAIPPGFTTIFVACSGYARFATNGTGVRSIGFLVNGVVVEQRAVVGGISADVTFVPLPEVWAEVAAGDVITMQVTQSSGGALNLQKASAHIKRIGPAS